MSKTELYTKASSPVVIITIYIHVRVGVVLFWVQ